ncbi:hypothetical protein ACFQHV_21115 [Promicromonospora thailandica]|uniref:Uncharacterized protein n=1 Tax=Promicromonospora thailandica TaxID=765201 RepID=A0A9X2JTC2_9MICO|nr:hypothetical protein [Promicromonospora thailandica]MCP2263295.1 hypothetical protein [Promicromonospora thailandica]BFF18700.1 hypothetical protein GCM10025730_22210 [Promicromonospora thailandica]
MNCTRKRLAAAALVLGGLLVLWMPAASATPFTEGINFFSGDLSGESATYAGTVEGCVVLPFVAHSELNYTDTAIRVFESTDCTGNARTFPGNDLHSFLRFDARSFEPIP